MCRRFHFLFTYINMRRKEKDEEKEVTVMRNIIKRTILTAVCIFTIASQTMPVMAADTPQTVTVADATQTSDAIAIFNLCNQKRLEAGLRPYTWNAELARAASVRAAEASKALSHVRPDGTAFYTVSSEVYGENLSWNLNDATGIVTGWMNSTLHRANLLDAGYRTCGIAIYKVGNTWYCAAEFGY